MSAWTIARRAQIGAALASCGDAEELGANRWRLDLGGPASFVEWEGEWLRFDCSVASRPTSETRSFWHLLSLQHALPPGPKLIAPRGAALHLLADVDVAASSDIAADVRRMCVTMRDAHEALRRPSPQPGSEPDDATALSESLRQSCSECGWKVTNRGARRLAVDLAITGDFAQATVERRRGVIVADAAVTDDEVSSEVCREALGLLLLRLNGAVRLVRASVRPEALAPYLEAYASDDPGAAALDRLFSALSVAWSMVGREARVLAEDESLARLFLKSHHRGAAEGRFEAHSDV